MRTDLTLPLPTGAVDTIRVLHIDDEREALQMAKKLLEMLDMGLNVESVSSPVDAIEMLRGGGFDCVVSDFKMSPMDGIELARRIRESSDIPIIIYTGHGSEEVAEAAFTVGIDDYVRKELHPRHYEVLANRIRGVVEKRRVETLYGDILEGSRDGVLLLEGTKFLYANRAQADLLGVADPRELIGRDTLDWIVEDDRMRVKEISLRRQRGEDVPSTYEYRILASSGEPRVIETSVTLIDYRGKKASLAFTREITERKKLEEERLERSRTLEMRVEERTRKLLDAERMAAAGSIAAMVGHDLRGPLQSIKNAAYLLRKGLQPTEEVLDIIDDSVNRATRMLQEFRDQTHESPLYVTTIKLGSLLRQTVKEFGIPEDIDATVDVSVKTASLDILKIRRVLDNMLRNAVEAMPKGGELLLRASRRDKGLVIEVSDTGEGIPDVVMENLFKPFHTTKPGGLGLGLAYCKRAVEAHGGSITVETQVGAGTTFTIRLPDA